MKKALVKNLCLVPCLLLLGCGAAPTEPNDDVRVAVGPTTGLKPMMGDTATHEVGHVRGLALGHPVAFTYTPPRPSASAPALRVFRGSVSLSVVAGASPEIAIRGRWFRSGAAVEGTQCAITGTLVTSASGPQITGIHVQAAGAPANLLGGMTLFARASPDVAPIDDVATTFVNAGILPLTFCDDWTLPELRYGGQTTEGSDI